MAKVSTRSRDAVESTQAFVCVFSLHKAVETTIYNITMSNRPSTTRLAERCIDAKISDLPTKTEMLDQCRRLLHAAYVQEIGWHPSSEPHTRFDIRPDQLCDRFDGVGVWAVVLDSVSPRARVLGCVRILAGKLAAHGKVLDDDAMPNLDIVGYPNCPKNFINYVRDLGARNVCEFQRMAIGEEHRCYFLPLHLTYTFAIAFNDKKFPVLYSPELTIVGAFQEDRLRRTGAAASGLVTRPEWTFYYCDTDPAPVLTGSCPNSKIPKRLEAHLQKHIQAEIKRQQEVPATNMVASRL